MIYFLGKIPLEFTAAALAICSNPVGIHFEVNPEASIGQLADRFNPAVSIKECQLTSAKQNFGSNPIQLPSPVFLYTIEYFYHAAFIDRFWKSSYFYSEFV